MVSSWFDRLLVGSICCFPHPITIPAKPVLQLLNICSCKPPKSSYSHFASALALSLGQYLPLGLPRGVQGMPSIGSPGQPLTRLVFCSQMQSLQLILLTRYLLNTAGHHTFP